VTDDEGATLADAGLSDEEMVEQVADQTSSDLRHADVFEREANGTTTDTEARQGQRRRAQG
jgi:hypothetical protein